jgi:hypothetical protein
VWLFADSDQPGRLVERWHCSRCQPHQVEIIMCGSCGSTVMLGGDLAAQADQLLGPARARPALAHRSRLAPAPQHLGMRPASRSPAATPSAPMSPRVLADQGTSPEQDTDSGDYPVTPAGCLPVGIRTWNSPIWVESVVLRHLLSRAEFGAARGVQGIEKGVVSCQSVQQVGENRFLYGRAPW